MALLGAAVIGVLIGRLEEFWGRFGGEQKNEGDGEGVSSDLLLAVSSASPVPLPDVPQDILDQKNRFTIVLEQEAAAPDALFANTPDVIIGDRALAGELPPPAPDRSDEDDDDEGIVLWRGDEGSAPAISQADPGAPADSTGEILSETPLPQAEAITESDPRFVSITQLNEQMGPPAPEDDDDEGGWLWFGDGPGAWFASAVAGLFGGGLGSAGAGAASLGDAAVTGLNIAFAAGPFVDGKLAIRAVDGQGNELFVYEGESPGDTLGAGVTLAGVETDTVAGEPVITGLEVQFDDFSGPVFLQIEDTSAYIDESLGEETTLDIPLRGSAEVPPEGIAQASLTPFTELAIQLIEETGTSVTLDASNVDGLTAARGLLDSAADRVRDLTGVDIRDTRPVAVNQASFQSSDDLDANQYGLKLAALSEFAGSDETGDRVQNAINSLTANVSPVADAAQRTIEFQNPGTALRNQTDLTDSLDAFVDRDESIRERVIDADRPDTPPTIGEFLVIDDVPVIEGEAQFIDRENTALEDSNLSLRVALGDDTVFSVDADDASGDEALTVVKEGDADTAGTWRLTLSDLDPGAYSLDVFVVDEASNTTKAEGRDANNAPVIQFIGEGVIAPDAADGTLDADATIVRRTLTEGDDAAAVSATGRLAIGDLDAGETVQVRDSELVKITGNTQVLDVGESALGGYFSLPVGEVLNESQQIAFEDWNFSGNAGVFDRLGGNESVTLLYDFLVDDSEPLDSNKARLEITVEGTNDAPEISGAINVAADVGDARTTVDLLADATDADVNDTLSVTDLSFAVNGSSTGNGGSERPEGIRLDGTELIFEPNSPAFENLPLGETRVIEASYTITDGNGGTVNQTATITLTGTEVAEPSNNAPTITVTANDFTEDDGAVAENAVVATYTTADEEGDGLTVTFTGAVPDDGSGNALYTLDTANSEVLLTSAGAAYVNAGNDLPAVDLTVTDDGSPAQTGTGSADPTVTLVNDAPTITVTANDFTEDDGAVAENAVVATYTTADEEGDGLTVTFTGAVPDDGSGNALYTLDTANSEVLLTSAGAAYVNAGNDLPAVDLTVTDDGSPAQTGTGSADPTVTLVNDAPVLDSTEDPSLSAIAEDIPDANNAGTVVSAIVVDGSVTDEDGSAAEAIHVTTVDETNGSWQFSTDSGSSWTAIDFSGGNPGQGLLLDASDEIRFTPNADFNGSADLTFGAWDKSTGSAGTYVAVSSTGADTAFSSATDTASIAVTPVNDAPVASGDVTLKPVDEDTADPAGATVSSLVSSQLDDSADEVAGGSSADAFAGIAITGYTADTAKGEWEFSLDGESSWTAISGGPTDGSALILAAADELRFVPASDFNGAAPDLTVRLIEGDLTGFTSDGKADVSGDNNGGITQLSAQTIELGTTITSVNDAPVVDTSNSALAGSVTENASGDETPAQEAVAVGNVAFTDVDAGESLTVSTSTADADVTLAYTASGVGSSPSLPSELGAAALRGAFSITDEATGAWKYDASELDLEALGSGDTVELSYTLTGEDAAGATADEQVTVTITGSNDAPEVTVPGSINSTEDELETGITVTAVTSNLLDNASDVDDEDTTLVIGEVNGDSADVGDAVTVTLSYADADGVNQSQDVDLTVNQNGSYELSKVDWDELPAGGTATGTFAYRVEDRNGGLSSEQTANITISGTNDAPTLDESKSPQLAGIDEDISNSLNGGTRVDELIASGSIDDPDGPSDDSIYVTAVDETNGGWQFSTDSGSSWTAIDLSGDNAGKGLLLDASDEIRFVPATHYNGSATIDFGAWDETTGKAGDYADVSERGGATAFSSMTDTASIEISPVNDAPVASGDVALAEVGEDTVDPNGDIVGQLFADSFDDSRDGDLADGLAGIAVTNNAADGTAGNWQYNVSGTWETIGTSVSDANALILNGFESLRFLPATDFNGAAPALTVRLIEGDFTGFTSGGTADVSGDNNGGTTEVSDQTIALGTTITSVNDAPVVSKEIEETVTEDDPAQTVDLLAGATDVDSGDSLSAVDFTYTVDGDATGNDGANPPDGITVIGNELTVNPENPAFQGLADGDTRTIVAGYEIQDGSGGLVEQTAAITITGLNDAPEITATSGTVTHTESDDSTPVNITSDDFAISTVEAVDTISELAFDVTNVADAGEILNIDGSGIDLLTAVTGGSTDSYTYDVTYDNEDNVATVTLRDLSLSESTANELVRFVTYENTSGSPTETDDRNVSITVVDSGGDRGTGNDTTTAPLNTINVEAVFSGLDISVAAGPFVDGKLAIRAVDIQGNELFVYEGQPPGETVGEGATLTEVATDTVDGQQVIAGLKVRFDDFSGPVFLQVEDTSSYIDESLGEETQLDIPLRGSAEVPDVGFGVISLTPFTELAIQLVEQATGQEITLDADSAGVLNDALPAIDSAADRVRELTGVDIRDTRPVAVNQTSFQSNDDPDANQYGLKLAALSEFSGEEEKDSRVQRSIDRLKENVSPSSDPETGNVVFENPGAALRNQTSFTDSQDSFVERDETIRGRVVDSDRPVTPPTIGEFLVIDDTPVITGDAQFFDRANTAEEDSDLSLRVALSDTTVFSADPIDGSDGSALEIIDSGDVDTPGTWRLTLTDLDPGAYSLDVFVVDTASNTSQAEGRDEDSAPIIQWLGEGVASSDIDDELAPDATLMRRTLTEGDDAAAVSTTGQVAIGDLDAGETVQVVDSELAEMAGDTSILGVSPGVIEGYFSVPTGQVLDANQQIAFKDWRFDGDAAVFDRLAVGESVTLVYDFSVEDSDLRVSNSARLEVVVQGTNDDPLVTEQLGVEVEAGEPAATVDLLAGTADVDVSDTLAVANLTYTVDGEATGNSGQDLPAGVRRSGSDLMVDPTDATFEGLAPDETNIIVASYTVDDGNGGSVAQTATITITGESPNEPPSGSDGKVTVDEDQTYTLQASDFGFSDPEDGDAFDSVLIAALPGAGELKLSGNAVSSGDSIPVEAINGGDLTFTPAADANGTGYASFDFQVIDNGGVDRGGKDTDQTPNTLTFDVTPINDAPLASGDVTLTSVDEDTTGPAGATVSSLVSSSFDDPADDVAGGSSADSFAGIAITGYTEDTTKGEWQFSTNQGSNWTAISDGPTDGTALILAAADELRFVPAADFNGAAPDLTVRLLEDLSSFTAGQAADVSTNGGETAISAETIAIQTTVNDVNDAPVASGDVALAEVEEDTADPNGDIVGQLFADSFDDSRDGDLADGLAGIAVIGNAADGTAGNWQYNVSGTWETIGTSVSDANALILDGFSSLRFVPAADFNGAAPALTVRLIEGDFTGFTSGGTADVSGINNGGTTEVSDQTIALGTTITSVNDAPTLSGATISAAADDVLADGGVSVGADASALLDNANDVDHARDELDIDDAGAASGSLQNAGTALTISLDYTDANGDPQTGDVTLTINADGSYSLSNLNAPDLPEGEVATGAFVYNVIDPLGAESSVATGTLEITGGSDSTLDVDLSAGPFVTGTFAIEGFDSDGNQLFTYENGSITSGADRVEVTALETETGLRGNLQLPEAAAAAAQAGLDNLPPQVGGGNSEASGLTKGFSLKLSDYQGDVWLRVSDAEGSQALFIDEATGDAVTLDSALRGYASTNAGTATGISLTPYTEAAVRLAEEAAALRVDLDSPEAASLSAARALYDSAADIVADLVGVDPSQVRAQPINLDATGGASDKASNQYGLKLAALSESGVSVDGGIDTLLSDLAASRGKDGGIDVDAAAAIIGRLRITDRMNEYLSDAVADARPTGADGDFAVVDDQAPDADTIVIDTLDARTATPAVTGTVILTDTLNPLGNDDDLAFEVVINGRVFREGDGLTLTEGDGVINWSLDWSAADALEVGRYDVVAVLTDSARNATADTTTDELLVLPQGGDSISGDVRDNIIDETAELLDGSAARTPASDEFIFGDAGDDVILGYDGSDILIGEQDDDVLIGGAGDDTLRGGAGDDSMAGGDGNDAYRRDIDGHQPGSENIFVGNDGTDVATFAGGTADYLINALTRAEIDTLNELLNDSSSDPDATPTILGQETPDLQFDVDETVLRVDQVTALGRQTDFIQAERIVFADAVLVDDPVTGFVTTETASDAFVYNGGGRPLQDSSPNSILGGDGDDRIIGGDGDDDLRGGAGDDVLVSVGGSDTLSGGKGDDTLAAMGKGTADATLSGNAGSDTFIVAPEVETSVDVRIADFEVGEDLINLDGLYADASGGGIDSSALSEIVSVLDAQNGVAEIDLEGFFVVNRAQDDDPQTNDEYAAVSGGVEVTFSNASVPDDTASLFAEQNPVGSSDWWNDLIDAGGIS
ncbi:hypothetical protein BA899_07465 [Spiribacter sp. SSL99]|nr:hypothetical protein BA899_07465 [Spiribacter sp. SSL99]